LNITVTGWRSYPGDTGLKTRERAIVTPGEEKKKYTVDVSNPFD